MSVLASRAEGEPGRRRWQSSSVRQSHCGAEEAVAEDAGALWFRLGIVSPDARAMAKLVCVDGVENGFPRSAAPRDAVLAGSEPPLWGQGGAADRAIVGSCARSTQRSECAPGERRFGMRKLGIACLFVAVALAFAGVAYTVPSKNNDELLKDEAHFLEQMNKTFSGGTKAAQMRNMEVVGRNDLGGRGFNADVWFHDGFAYVGHWGFTDFASGSNTRFCPEPPNNGGAVRDPRDPAHPVMVSRLENPNGSSAEDVVVFDARFGPRAGRDIAAAGIQVCGGSRLDPSFPRGLMLWDVSDPANPVELGFVDT